MIQCLKTEFLFIRFVDQIKDFWISIIAFLLKTIALDQILETVVTFHFSGGKVYSLNTYMIKVVIITNLEQKKKSA